MVFKHLKKVNLKIKLGKYQFFKQHLHYLGHLISEQVIWPLPEMVTSIENLKQPNNIDEVYHFLGLTGYYRKFVLLFADITKPINKLPKKDTKFQLSPQCRQLFSTLRKHSVKSLYFSIPKMEKPYTLFTDASNYAYSEVLTQAVDSPEDLRSIAYTSGSLSNMQKRWSVTGLQSINLF